MPWFAYVMIGLYILSSIGIVLLIDEPRKPVTKEYAICQLIVNALVVWGIVALATN